MRHVVSTGEVPHLWANKAQDNARNRQGNLFFENLTIYSYGRHFPIARHIVNDSGTPAILFTTRRYSVTTSQHTSAVRSAIPNDILVIPTANVDRIPDESILDAIQEDINELALKAKRSRKYAASYRAEIEEYVKLFNETAQFIGSNRTPSEPSKAELDAKVKEQREAAKLARIEQVRRETERLNQYAKDIEAWKQGENIYLPYGLLKTAWMRIEGDEIVTTQGARVPLEHVKRVAPLIISLIKEGKTYQRNGHTLHLGAYAIESLDSNGTLTVGCHRFAKDEILRIAALLTKEGE